MAWCIQFLNDLGRALDRCRLSSHCLWALLVTIEHGLAGAIQLRAQLHCNLLQPSWDRLPGSEHNRAWIWRSQQQSTSASKFSQNARATCVPFINTAVVIKLKQVVRSEHKLLYIWI